jgi:hypothetical protein
VWILDWLLNQQEITEKGALIVGFVSKAALERSPNIMHVSLVKVVFQEDTILA